MAIYNTVDGQAYVVTAFGAGVTVTSAEGLDLAVQAGSQRSFIGTGGEVEVTGGHRMEQLKAAFGGGQASASFDTDQQYPPGYIAVFGSSGQVNMVLFDLNTGRDVSNAFRENTTMEGLPDGVTMPWVDTARSAFYNCTALKGLPYGCTLERLRDGQAMFFGCTSLHDIPGTVTFESLESGKQMFSNCTALEGLPDSVDLGALTDGYGMFSGCTALKGLPDNGLCTLKPLVTGTYMFQNCSALEGMPAGCKLSSLEQGYGMFQGCTSLHSIPDIDLGSLVNGTNMFSGCSLDEETAYNALSTLPTVTNTPAFCVGSGELWAATSRRIADLLGVATLPIPAGSKYKIGRWTVTVQ